jgi:uncharacterized membrane protein (DUF4010 family)
MTSAEQWHIALRMAVAALGGLAVGIEREWSGRAQGERPRFAGVRTFLLIGLLGALGTLFFELGYPGPGLFVFGGSVLLIAIAYGASAYHGDRESTTEFAAIVVLAAGGIAGTGHIVFASAITVFVALVLMEKTLIHSFVFRIRSEDLSAGLRFAVLALVVLPLLPEGPYGPEPGIRPRELWALVLLFCGLSFIGLIAKRAAGAKRGYAIAGMLGGIISSTMVTLNFSRESQKQKNAGRALAIGVIAACTVLPARVAILSFVLNRQIAFIALPTLAIVFALGILITILMPGKENQSDSQQEYPKNPLRLFNAIQMVLIFQAALFAFHWIQQKFGSTGVLASSALAGLTDVDTLIFMIGKEKKLDVGLAANALIIGVMSNTALKMLLALVIGKGPFRMVAGFGLLMLLITILICFFLFL